MKNAIPASSTIAPIAIPTAAPPLSPLLPAVEEVVGLTTVGLPAVEVGAVAGETGRPGARGFVGPCPADAAGSASVTPAATGSASVRPATRSAIWRRTPTAQASGCSIAGVSGASTYGCSSVTSSSWYTLSALTAQMSWWAPSRMFSTARIAVNIEWSELL
jgi:hypothetical protein